MLIPNASPTFSLRFSKPILTNGIILCLFGLLLTLCPAAPLDENATRALVEKITAARAKNPSIQASFKEEKTGGILARPAISSGKLFYTAPNKFRRETQGGGRESLIVSNGELLWMYYPAFNEAERYDLKKQKFLNQGISAFTTSLGLENVERDFKISAEETDSTYRIALIPKRSSLSRMIKELVVAFDKNLDLQSVETLSPKGEKTMTTLSDFRKGPQPSTLFDFTPPAGASVSTPLGK